MAWKSLLKEKFATKDGFIEELHILAGPTFPCAYYAGPVHSQWNLDGHGMDYTPRFNGTSFYHRTEDEALGALIIMRDDLAG